ncbi:hypothetical protein BRI9_2927 [plant metagenome]|uniref:Uncharacterized protein n=1 Tax=plant metagenome TaxID=1297885 RepID=A0A484YU86_9ZZZZ
MVGQQWQLIDEPDHFPAVDMLISYPSTLAVEYETVGVRSLLHPLDFPVDKARVLATALCHRLAGEERSGDQIPFQS